MATIFVSFNHTDGAFVDRLAQNLKAQGHTVFSTYGAKPGEDWQAKIDGWIETSSVHLAVLTPRYMASEWAQQELARLRKSRDAGSSILIPLLLEPCDLPKWLTQITWIEFSDYSSGILKLLERLREIDVSEASAALAKPSGKRVTPPAAGSPRRGGHMGDNSNRAALIGLAGAIVAALIGAWATLHAGGSQQGGADPGSRPAPAPPPAASAPASSAGSAFIHRVWLEQNAPSAGQEGLRIHVAFDAKHLVGAQLTVAAGFTDANGNDLQDADGKFRFDDGTVGVTALASASSDDTRFDDFVLFIPYAQLHMRPGSHTLKVKVGISQAERSGFLAVSYPVAFTFTS